MVFFMVDNTWYSLWLAIHGILYGWQYLVFFMVVNTLYFLWLIIIGILYRNSFAKQMLQTDAFLVNNVFICITFIESCKLS